MYIILHCFSIHSFFVFGLVFFFCHSFYKTYQLKKLVVWDQNNNTVCRVFGLHEANLGLMAASYMIPCAMPGIIMSAELGINPELMQMSSRPPPQNKKEKKLVLSMLLTESYLKQYW